MSNVSGQPKSAGMSSLSNTSSALKNNTVLPPQQNKIQQSSPKVGLLSPNVVKDVKSESSSIGVRDQAAKPSADKEKVHSLPDSKRDKSSSGSGSSLANLWGRASAKPKTDCAPTDGNNYF